VAATSGTDLYFGIPVLAAIALGGFRALVSLVGARFGFATGLAVFVDLAFALAMRAMVSPSANAYLSSPKVYALQ